MGHAGRLVVVAVKRCEKRRHKARAASEPGEQVDKRTDIGADGIARKGKHHRRSRAAKPKRFTGLLTNRMKMPLHAQALQHFRNEVKLSARNSATDENHASGIEGLLEGTCHGGCVIRQVGIFRRKTLRRQQGFE